MNFFEHQEKARNQTRLMVFLFILAVIATIIAIDGLVLLLANMQTEPDYTATETTFVFPVELLVTTSVVTLAIILLGSLFRMMQLRSGGKAVAAMMGARLVHPDSQNSKERRLLNIVEEMAIASGITVPPVYVMEGEQSINAFAAGFRQSGDRIGVAGRDGGEVGGDCGVARLD